MSDRCHSTLVCAERDKDIFEKMAYRVEELKALSVALPLACGSTISKG